MVLHCEKPHENFVILMRLFYEAMQQNRNFGRGCEVPDKENAWRTNQFHVPDCRQGTAKKILRGLCGWIQTCVTRKRPAVSQGPHKDVRTQRAHEPGGERKRGLLRKRRNSSVGTLRFFQRKIGASLISLAPTWRKRWDSNPRSLLQDYSISSRGRYDHFDTLPSITAGHIPPQCQIII